MKSMNVYIDELVTEAAIFDDEIESLFYDIAMEEEVAKDPAQPGREEPGAIDKMMKAIKELFMRLDGMIQRTFMKFKTFLMRVAQTDQGFENNFRKAFVAKKPLEAIKLISYDYNPDILHNELVKVNQSVFKLFSGMANKTSYTALSDINTANDMDRTPDEIYKIIFKNLGCPSEVTDINTYFLHIKNKYRQNKTEKLFKSSETKLYHDITKSHDKLTNEIKQSQSTVAQQVATLKSNLHNTIQNRQARPEVKKRAMKQCKNLTHVLNFYLRFVDLYMQLQLERMFTYRTVLKKLYDFS